jgi:DNA mismatch repair protein MutL
VSADPSVGVASEPPRIRPLGDALADQIAAGEVVERPASVVKELLENAIDAGARRVRIELQEGGVGAIVVVDDGCGIHPDDLMLAVTRHATSKLRAPADLVEITTLGFRGEALASIAAVAHLEIRSRPRSEARGTALRCRPGLPPEAHAVGMPVGTRVELRGLFSNVPARRKFLRSEATEVGHVTQTVLRVALVQPSVHVSLHHGERRLLDLPACSPAARVEQVLARGQRASLRHVEGEHDGVRVQAWLCPADAALRDRTGLYVVVRRRVVREPNVARIVSASYGDSLGAGRHPLACVLVEPPRGEVDVNVHPQKSEVRFSAPQRVYAAVRAVLGAAEAATVAGERPGAAATHAVGPGGPASAPSDAAGGSSNAARASLGAVLDRWADHAASSVAREPAPGYRLRTRAAEGEYSRARETLREQARALHQAWRDDRADDPGPGAPAPTPPLPFDRSVPTPGAASLGAGPSSPSMAEAPRAAVEAGPELLGCLPGPVGLYVHEGELLAVDLRALRSHLVLRRLREGLGGGEVAAQGLLPPVVVRLPPADAARCHEGAPALARLGLHLEGFGDDAVLVRAVPAALRHCVAEPDVADLVARVLPWLRVHGRVREGAARADATALADAMQAMARTKAPDPAPRLARRWLRELLEQGVPVDEVPGLRRWDARTLTGRTPDGAADRDPPPARDDG